MHGNCCFFIGHRDTDAEIYPTLVSEVERHITEYGVNNFLSDAIARLTCWLHGRFIESKKSHPDVRLTMRLPYYPSLKKVKIPSDFDGSYFPEGQEKVPPRLAIVRVNEHMIRSSDYLICFASHPSSGTGEVMEMALKRQKRGLIRVTNLAGWYPEV